MRRMRPNALSGALGGCACAFALSGCFILNMLGNVAPGPRLQNQYAHDIEYEIERTDGSVKAGALPPCGTMDFFPPHGSLPRNWTRTVFVKRLTIHKDSVEIARLDRDDIEGSSQGRFSDDRVLALDETGLRSLGFLDDIKWPILECSLILNTFAEDLQVRVVYRDGSEAHRIWGACKPFVWSGMDIGRRGRARGGGLVRFVVTRDSEVLHDLDRREFRASVGKKRPGMMLITESGFERSDWALIVGYDYAPLGSDYRRHCALP